MYNTFVDVYKNKRDSFFKWRSETTVVHKVVMAFTFACFTGMGAYVKFYLPFTPVPLTLQVFFVLLSGVVLGKWYGGLSQTIYVGLGAIGIPWFTTQSALIGVTGGYLLGFIFAAEMIGRFTDKNIQLRNFQGMLVLMFLAVGIIYAFGALQFSLIMGTNFYETMTLAVLPFIVGDVLKAGVAATIGCAITPKKAY